MEPERNSLRTSVPLKITLAERIYYTYRSNPHKHIDISAAFAAHHWNIANIFPVNKNPETDVFQTGFVELRTVQEAEQAAKYRRIVSFDLILIHSCITLFRYMTVQSFI